MNAIRKVSKSFFISFFLCVVIGLVAIYCGVGALPFTVAPYSLLLLDNMLCGRTLSVVVVVVEVDEASPQLLHGKNSKKISLRKQKSSKRENFNKIFIFYRNYRRGGLAGKAAGWGLASARPVGRWRLAVGCYSDNSDSSDNSDNSDSDNSDNSDSDNSDNSDSDNSDSERL